MKKTKHLLVDLSTHGFGHFAQTSMVLNALHRLDLPLRITIRSKLPESIIKERLNLPVNSISYALDIGLTMHNPVEIDREASYQYYQALHQHYEQAVEREMEELEKLQPDFILANVPYLSLSAAAKLNIPSMAMCSLNWAEIFSHYCGDYPEAQSITQQIREAYASAEQFLTVTPAMPMPGLNNTQTIPPIAHRGQCQTELLRNVVNNPQAQFVLVNLGGIPNTLDTSNWPVLDNIYWIVGSGIQSVRADIVSQDIFDMAFIDLLSSCHAVLTKTGYGMLVEATVNQVPVICITRNGWPEEPALFKWVQAQGYLQIIQLSEFNAGDFAKAAEKALATRWKKPPTASNGAEIAAKLLANYLK